MKNWEICLSPRKIPYSNRNKAKILDVDVYFAAKGNKYGASSLHRHCLRNKKRKVKYRNL